MKFRTARLIAFVLAPGVATVEAGPATPAPGGLLAITARSSSTANEKPDAGRAADATLALASARAPSSPGMDVTFTSSGLARGGAAERNWEWRLNLASIGRSGTCETLPSAVRRTWGEHVEYHHADIVTWFDALPHGILHGIAIPAKPFSRDAGNLDLHLQVSTNLSASAADSHQDCEYRGPGMVLRYSGLQAWDATGRGLPCEISHATVGEIVITLDDTDCAYPVLIDPLIHTQVAHLEPTDPLT